MSAPAAASIPLRQTLAAVLSLLSSYALLLLANGLFTTLLSVRTKIEGFPTEVVGMIVAAYFLGLLLGGLFAARVVASVGHIRSFAAFASLMSVTALGIVLVVDPVAWGAFRLCAGFCMAGMIMVTESWLNERATNRTRGQVMALYMTTNYMASGSGQFILPLGDPADFQLFCIASIVYSLALVPVLLTRASAPRPQPPRRVSFGELWRTSPLGLVGACGAGVVNASFFGLGPVFTHGIGLTLAQTSAFMAAGIFGGLLLQWPVGRLSDRVDRRVILASITLGTAVICFAVVAVAGRAFLPLIALLVAYGGLSFTVYSISAAHTNDFAEPERLVQVASALLVAYGIGACAGPLVASALMGQVGPKALFAMSGSVYLALGLFAFYRMRRRAPKARDERKPIIVLPGGQHTAGQLYNAMRDQMDRDLAHMSGHSRRNQR